MSSKRRAATVRAARASDVKRQVQFAAPRTQLARAALEARRQYMAAGGRLLSLTEINAEVAARRGGDRTGR
jgi:hypothetical protein